MSPGLILSVIVCYFVVLVIIMRLTSRGAVNTTFFTGDRKSPWFLVAFGMIGASLSGVTFLSIPGQVGNPDVQFSYMQMVFGYFAGYMVVSFVLMPVFYKKQVVSIYSYLGERFGFFTHKTGAFFFIVSRLIGSAIRLLLVVNILQIFVFDAFNVPFEATVIISVGLIWLYTNKGGIKTIIWTDTFQTAFMLLTVVAVIVFIYREMGLHEVGFTKAVGESGYARMFYFDDPFAKNYFWKHFLGGVFITIGMTGLDQDMMQKNLSCKNIGDAQKNMVSFAAVLIGVNLLFLALGALLFMYADFSGLTEQIGASDTLLPTIALSESSGAFIGVLFLLGLIAAAYSSADGSMTALTTSVAIDFMDIEKEEDGKNRFTKEKQEKLRKVIHRLVAVLTVAVVILLKYTTSDAAINSIMFFAGFTYGPLIALFFFGILTKRKLVDRLVPFAGIAGILFTLLIWGFSKGGVWVDEGEPGLLGNYMFGFELIIVNAVLTFLLLFTVSTSVKKR